MNLSAVTNIMQTVDYDPAGFNFLSTVEDLIGNKEYSDSCRDCLDGVNNSQTFYWKAISAVGDEMSEAVYKNIRNYIQYVSDVDTCKIKSLRSMLHLFNYKSTALDNFMNMPVEVLKLLDIFSIGRQYLSKTGFLKPECIADFVENRVFEKYTEYGFDMRSDFVNGQFLLSTDAKSGNGCNVQKMQWPYAEPVPISGFIGFSAVYDLSGNLSGYVQDPDRLDVLTSDERCGYPLSTVQQLSGYKTGNIYRNSRGYMLADVGALSARIVHAYDETLHGQFAVSSGLSSLRRHEDNVEYSISDIYSDLSSSQLSGYVNLGWLSANLAGRVQIALSGVGYSDMVYDDDQYRAYVKRTFKSLLYGRVVLPYNLQVGYMGQTNPLYIYPYLGHDYYDTSASFFTYFNSEDDDDLSAIRDVKAKNNISWKFDEQRIYDMIEQGQASLTDYSGAELCVLLLEKNRRERPLNLNDIKLPDEYCRSQVSLKHDQTRYSYYRKRKVVEYANFIDRYYSMINGSDHAVVYDFDSNYWQLGADSGKRVLSMPNSVYEINPEVDIDADMIDVVAEYLAMAALYIRSLRMELRLQTQKNYMRGTNLLLIYVINEYLRSYGTYNSLSGGNILGDPDFAEIRDSMKGHQLAGTGQQNYSINVQEYYDPTEYFNIKTRSTPSADFASAANRRFWEKTENGHMMDYDGPALKLAEIERFYLSSLGLDRATSGDLQSFLSTVYDLGANDSFMYSTSSDTIFSPTLSDGHYASDVYGRLLALSNSYRTLVDAYLSSGVYQPTGSTADEQISDVLSGFVYPNLSSQYLAGISDVYDAFKIKLDGLSGEIDSLSTSVYDFTHTTYKCYYGKSESEFAYADWDIDAGQYLFPYFNGNVNYEQEGDNLYNKLYQLRQYSTAQNIRNFPLLSILTYINENLYSLSSDLRENVIRPLQLCCGYIDVAAAVFDDELKRVYEYVDGLITSRYDFMQSQLKSLQTQAQNLKAQYDTLNNTFTNAVANFNDNNTGYKLGDSKIYYFALFTTEGLTVGAGRTDNPPVKTKWDTVVYVPEAQDEPWYYAKSGKKSGKYKYGYTDLADLTYNPKSSLEARCEQVSAYMNAPTYIEKIDSREKYGYGLRTEGIVAVCDNVKSGLADMRASFDVVASQANSLFGIEKPVQTDLYNNILELAQKLTAVDQTYFMSDSTVMLYKGYLKVVSQTSSDYQPVKLEYEKIFADRDQLGYLADFQRQDGLTFQNLASLSSYVQKTDKANLLTITGRISEFIDVDFQKLLNDKTGLQTEMRDAGIPNIAPTAGNDVEQCVHDMYYSPSRMSGIKQDVINKTTSAEQQIYEHKQRLTNDFGTGYVDIIRSEISTGLSTSQNFTVLVKNRLSELNFFEHEIYGEYKNMFLTYGGRDFCYDPYYNIKNVTHPSYQIHPYLWDFVKKSGAVSLIDSGFRSSVVDSLIEEQVLDTVKKGVYVGKYGQTVNTWKATNEKLVDYSGYMSMYEKQSNWSTKLNSAHEVVDYEGAFYPPAVAAYRSSPDTAVNSVSCMTDKASLDKYVDRELREKFSGDIRQYMTFNDDGAVELSAISPFACAVEPYLSTYVPMGECHVNQKINDYLSSEGVNADTVSLQRIIESASAGVPETFYGKYYVQLDISQAMAQRIAQQLVEYRDEIFDLTESRPAGEQYDIYKYGVDISKTHYMLFKKYENPSADYQEKRNTLGRMWLRLGDHPIAFPAFSGQSPAYYIYDVNMISPVIRKLALKNSQDGIQWKDASEQHIIRINDRLEYFYDFEITQNKAAVSYVMFDPAYPTNLEFYRQYRLAVVASAPAEQTEDQTTGVKYCIFRNQPDQTVDYIDFHKGNTFGYTSKNDILDWQALTATGVSYPALVGCHVYQENSINFVYTYHDFRLEQSLSGFIDKTCIQSDQNADIQSFAVQVDSGNSYRKFPDDMQTFNVGPEVFGDRAVTGDQTCVGFNVDNGTLAFAYITTLPDLAWQTANAETVSGSIDLNDLPDGPTTLDPSISEVTSHDRFVENITLVETKYSLGLISLVNVKDYNVNADMSYIPVYPGHVRQLDMPSKYGIPNKELSCMELTCDYYNFELLGQSKSIDQYIEMVNPDPDPYFDYEKATRDREFGRVYEDYMDEYGNAFMQIQNPSLSRNSPSRYGKSKITVADDKLTWEISLDDEHTAFRCGYADFEKAKVVIYNGRALGKNPYYVGDLRRLLEETELSYDMILSGDSADIVTSCEIGSGEIRATGTHRSMLTRSQTDTNRIDMISGIKCRLNYDASRPNDTSISFTFIVDTGDLRREFVKVPAGEIRMMIYDDRSLTVYQHYHMLDAHGAVQCRFYEKLDDNPDMPDDGRGWGLYFPDYMTDGLSSRYRSFFHDKSGLKTYLDQISLSDYENLSDVYVFRGNQMLGFKYDEELRFQLSSDLYYYPSLNVSYPKRAEEYVDRDMQFALGDSADLRYMQDMFSDRNLFVVRLEDGHRIADMIGAVDIPVMYNETDDVRVYEDFLSVDEVSTCLSVGNYDKYDKYDTRIAQYVHYTSNSSVQPGTGLSISDEDWKNKSMDYFSGRLAELSGIYAGQSEYLAEGFSREHQTIFVDSGNCDLSRYMYAYINYARTDDNGIDLYFNYFNYLDTPYVKMENGVDVKADTIRSTYLKLKPGENGVLDIVVQFKHYIGGVLYGYRNVKILTYRVYNISDDKPKFLMYKVYEIRKNSQSGNVETGTLSVCVDPITFSLSGLDPQSKALSSFNVTVYRDKNISDNYDFYLDYPNNVISVDESGNAGYYIDKSSSSSGLMHVIVTNPTQMYYKFDYQTRYTVQQTRQYLNMKYSIAIDEINVKDEDGLDFETCFADSYIQFVE